ncbi:MAG: hypothetical protein LBV76_02465 [Deltaproteobacteria bacterium]|jgi:hypothetical protein|nr:hypothetical protein [Deltaproteobacteria bacterium]
MNIKANSPESEEQQIQQLAEELIRVAGILTSEFKNLAQKNPTDSRKADSATVLIARLVPGLNQNIWKKLVKKYELDSWLSIPVGHGAENSVASIASALGDILSTRDQDALDEFTSRRCMVQADEKKFLFSYQE